MQGYRVLYNDVQNVVVMNTSAFYLKKKSLMCVANLHAVCFLQCGIIIYSKNAAVTDYLYIYLFTCLWCSFMNVMSKIKTLKNNYLVYSLYKK